MEAGTSRERVSSLHLKRQQIFPLCMEQRNCRSKGPWYILEAVSALELEGFQIMRSGILDAFLDGFTGAGLYERARLPGPPTTYRQAMIALTCGFAASLVVIGGFVYLIVHDHPKTAYVLISSLFAGTIIRLVRHRRRQGSLRETQDQE
jgi:hypothetical protein